MSAAPSSTGIPAPVTGRATALGRAVLIACGAIAAAGLVAVLLAYPDGTPVSSDPGAPAIPTWVTVLPAVVGIGAALVLPPRPPALRVAPVRGDRLALTTGLLMACAVAFPLLVGLLDWGGDERYVLAKAVLLIAVPAVVVGVLRGAVRIDVVRAAWRWWAPVAVVAVWFALSELMPWTPSYDVGDVDTATLVVAATATALTAGLGEELFYRRWLQTRLEAALGPWPGIALASLAFALMHLGSHGTGEPLLDVARVVVAQGSFGLFVGVLWWRYRNLLLVVVAHLLVNGWGVLVELASR